MWENCIGCCSSAPIAQLQKCTNELPQFQLAMDAISKQADTILELAQSISEKLSGPLVDKDNSSPCRMWYVGYLDRIEDKLNTAREILTNANSTL